MLHVRAIHGRGSPGPEMLEIWPTRSGPPRFGPCPALLVVLPCARLTAFCDYDKRSAGGAQNAEVGILDGSIDLPRPAGDLESVGRRGLGTGPGGRESSDGNDRIHEARQARLGLAL